MNKSDFIAKVKSMKQPFIEESSSENWEFTNCFWIIKDRTNFKNSFCTPLVKLTSMEYFDNNIQDYYNRKKAFEKKYDRWFKEATE